MTISRELARRSWDVVIVGGGHNGLTAAAYLGRAGLAVLVLERRDRLGGACTLEQPFTDPRYVMSPCRVSGRAVAPRRHRRARSARRGMRTFPVDPTQWTPFEDGTALFQWRDEKATARAVAEIDPDDVAGFLAYDALFARIRERLRAGPLGDVWLGDAPDRGSLEALFADDREALDVLLDAPIADVVERHVATSGCAPRSTARAASARSPVHGNRGRPGSTPITPSG